APTDRAAVRRRAVSDPLAWIDDAARDWSRRGLARALVPRSAAPHCRSVVGGATVVNFGTNDYLGLAADPRGVAAAQTAAESHGFGASASALVTGWSDVHQALARDLARFEQTESVALFPSGYAANVGTITALAGRGDAVYADRLDHACLIDGAR